MGVSGHSAHNTRKHRPPSHPPLGLSGAAHFNLILSIKILEASDFMSACGPDPVSVFIEKLKGRSKSPKSFTENDQVGGNIHTQSYNLDSGLCLTSNSIPCGSETPHASSYCGSRAFPGQPSPWELCPELTEDD